MAFDPIARGLSARTSRKLPAALLDFRGSPGAPAWLNRLAFRNAFAAGHKRLQLSPGDYEIDRIFVGDITYSSVLSQQPNAILPEGFSRLDGNGANLVFTAGRGIWCKPRWTWAHPGQVRSYLAADVAAGDTSISLEAGEGVRWHAGDDLLYQFGSLAYDLPETLNWGFARVASVTGDTLTLDRALPESFSVSSVSSQSFTDIDGSANRFNKTVSKLPIVRDVVIADVSGTAANTEATTEEFISFEGAQRITIVNCGARKVAIGFSLKYVEGATIENCWVEDANFFKPAAGKGISLAETRDVSIVNFRGKGLRRAIALEAGAQGQVIGGSFENTGDASTGLSYGSNCQVFSAVSRSRLSVRDFTITGHGGYVLTNVVSAPGDAGDVVFSGRLTMIHGTEPYSFQLDQLDCILDYRIAGQHQEWDFAGAYWWRRRIWLRNGMSQFFHGPPGVVKQARVYASSGLTFGTSGKLTGLYLRRPSGGSGANQAPNLVAGSRVNLPTLYGGSGFGGQLWLYRSEQLRLQVLTEAGASLDAAGDYIDVECLIAPDRLAPNFAWSSQADEFASFTGSADREAYFASYDLPNIAANGTLQVDFAIAGIVPGDHIDAVTLGTTFAGLAIRSAEAITGSCRVIFTNTTAAAIDKAPTSVRILWRKPVASG